MVKLSSGFTLVEVVFVVAIIGIVAGIAIPTYQHYLLKSQINRVVSELSVYKAGFEVQASSLGSLSDSDLGYVASSLTKANGFGVAKINPDGSGHIEVTMGGTAHPTLLDVIVRFERSVGGVWKCTIDPAGAPKWRAEYSPEFCRVI